MNKPLWIAIFLTAYSSLSATLNNDSTDVVADYLKEQKLPTRGYKDDGLGFTASSAYRELPSQGVMANNVAYYCEGTADKVSLVKVVLNVNSPQDATFAHATLISIVSTLSQKAIGEEISPLVKEAITGKQTKEWKQGGYNVKVITQTWPTGRGYEIKFLITIDTP